MTIDVSTLLQMAANLEDAGLIWNPEIGDEVTPRKTLNPLSILIDPQGMTPVELRDFYLWLPTVEQMVQQIEARQAMLFHAGLELSSDSLLYKTVVQARGNHFEACGETLRTSLGRSLCELLVNGVGEVH